MSGRGKRRSARLLKLEEKKNGNAAFHIDPWQVIQNGISGSSSRVRRRGSEEFQEASCSQEFDAINSDNLSSNNNSTGQIIEYILDVLELKDTHELFAMPDDIQITDYAERVNRPGDFATLRQKNKDGMYKTLEQFENDVYMVFHKAMAINHQNTIPYREAMSLQDQAKQVFQSLKNNRLYSELELSTWHQKYFNRLKRPRRTEASIGSSCYATQQRSNVRSKKCTTDKRQENPRSNVAENDRSVSENLSSITKSSYKTRKECSETCMEQRRLAYMDDETNVSSPITSVFRNQHATLVVNARGLTYQESLQRFARNAGVKARMAAEFKCLECTGRLKRSPVPVYRTGYSPKDMTNVVPQSSAQCSTPIFRASDRTDSTPVPDCKLQTDELLKYFLLIGTPEFLERSRNMSASSSRDLEQPSNREHLEQRSNECVITENARLVKSKAPEQTKNSKPVYSPFAPPKLLPSQLGFSQYATSIQPFKLNPSNAFSSRKNA